MGFNISGIAVAKNLHNEIKAIENEIGFGLELIEEITFESASSNWKEDGICDIYFGSNGTLIFLCHELSMTSYSILDLPTLTYAISETSMAFCFHYCENGKIRRSRAEAERKELQGEGERLDIEYTPIEISETIWQLIDKTIDQDFNQIDFSEKCYRYRLKRMEQSLLNNDLKDKQSPNNIDFDDKRFKVALRLFKNSRWIILVGIVLTVLTLTKVYENHFGFLTILFGVILRSLSSKYMRTKMKTLK